MMAGRTNPMPVPTMFMTERTAVATGRLNRNNLYILFLEPVGCNFGWGIKNERLADCTKELTDEDKSERQVDHAADTCSQSSHDRSNYDSLTDTLSI
jgi:hypothetical protein